jgi:hypothetical protein
MKYRICYKCGKVRHNFMLPYLGVCWICKTKLLLKLIYYFAMIGLLIIIFIAGIWITILGCSWIGGLL